MMLPFAILLTAAYLGYLLYEKKRNDKALASFRYVIHVNGIRGKTSVCRLIDANLRGAGFRVFTKTTGTTPFYIDTDGVEHLIRRHGPANIKEQLSIVRKAAREHAEVLIVECMAVDPALQKVAQEKMIRGSLNVITNVRYDHMFALGETLEEIADSLSNTIPFHGVLFTGEKTCVQPLAAVCAARDTRMISCETNEFANNENEAIAYAVGKYLGIPDADFRDHMKNYREDFGANKLYTVHGIPFLNLFSVNDPQSTRMVLNQYVQDTSDITIVYQHRPDRADRLLLFLRYFFPQVPCRSIIVMGQGRALAKRLLRKNGFTNVEEETCWDDIFRPQRASFVVGVGNIKGDAYEIIQGLEGGINE